MALTYSEMIPLGQKAAPFNLPGIDGKSYDLSSFRGKKALVVMFICNHCPYVLAVENRIALLAKEFLGQHIQFIGINSNDFEKYPKDAPDFMREQVSRAGFIFPYLVDETQRVARSYGAVCTPDIFVFDEDQLLVYRGRIDDSWKDETKVTKQDLKLALESLLQNKKPTANQMPAMGCSIKWK